MSGKIDFRYTTKLKEKLDAIQQRSKKRQYIYASNALEGNALTIYKVNIIRNM